MVFLCNTFSAGSFIAILFICDQRLYYAGQVEKLIKELPSVPADWPSGTISSIEKGQISNGISFQHAENGTNLRETQSMLLERIASEMNRLKFYIAHAQVYLAPSSHRGLYPSIHYDLCVEIFSYVLIKWYWIFIFVSFCSAMY